MLKKTNRRRAGKKSPRKLDPQEALEDAIDVQEARKILERIKATGEKPIPLSQVKKELGL